jgi:hypothetical protein
MYIVILDPFKENPSVICDEKGFIELFKYYESAKTAGEEALYRKDCKKYIIVQECPEK